MYSSNKVKIVPGTRQEGRGKIIIIKKNFFFNRPTKFKVKKKNVCVCVRVVGGNVVKGYIQSL